MVNVIFMHVQLDYPCHFKYDRQTYHPKKKLATHLYESWFIGWCMEGYMLLGNPLLIGNLPDPSTSLRWFRNFSSRRHFARRLLNQTWMRASGKSRRCASRSRANTSGQCVFSNSMVRGIERLYDIYGVTNYKLCDVIKLSNITFV